MISTPTMTKRVMGSSVKFEEALYCRTMSANVDFRSPQRGQKRKWKFNMWCNISKF